MPYFDNSYLLSDYAKKQLAKLDKIDPLIKRPGKLAVDKIGMRSRNESTHQSDGRKETP
jgi:hypothetical protein